MQWNIIFFFRHVNRIWWIYFTPTTRIHILYRLFHMACTVYVTPTCWYSWYRTLLVAHPTFSHCIFRPGSIFLLTARAFPLLNNFHCKCTCLKTPPRFYPCEYFCQVETTLIQYIRKYFRWLRIDDKTVVKYMWYCPFKTEPITYSPQCYIFHITAPPCTCQTHWPPYVLCIYFRLIPVTYYHSTCHCTCHALIC